ncbi:hypothetical protein FB45DRAFT_868414 [Roridomyces roridus]|uniref:Uncharacterized protein n=1 Tax=Roridomyces roridus TaxID=1738132 RepID=A0AAD7FLY2_9AGAR|nr:hypothetical protein FB45DRAFT_868414 [Roridomyces roridus]
MAWLETNLKPASNSNKTEEKPEDNRTSTRKRGLEFAFPETKTEPMVLDPEWLRKNGERASAELHALRYGEKGVKRRRRLEMMGPRPSRAPASPAPASQAPASPRSSDHPCPIILQGFEDDLSGKTPQLKFEIAPASYTNSEVYERIIKKCIQDSERPIPPKRKRAPSPVDSHEQWLRDLCDRPPRSAPIVRRIRKRRTVDVASLVGESSSAKDPE